MNRWSLIRASFYLLAIVVLIVMLETLIVILGCSWMVVIQRTEPVGVCQAQGNQIRDVITELITAILALLVASRGDGTPPDPPPD